MFQCQLMLRPFDVISFSYERFRHVGVVISHPSTNQKGETDWLVQLISEKFPRLNRICVANNCDFNIEYVGRSILEELLTHHDVQHRRAGVAILELQQKDSQCA